MSGGCGSPAAPTVAGLCERWLRLARSHARERAEMYPHLAAEYESAAYYALFRAARGYVSRGAEMWEQMPFPVWLRIITSRAFTNVEAVERCRHPLGFSPQDDPGRVSAIDRVPGRDPLIDEAAADADDLRHDLDVVGQLLDVLTVEDRELFLLRHLEGLTVSECARRVGRRRTGVHMRLERAMQRVLRAADELRG